eukprot:scaffold358_cov256-Pinguiococcus_pyrenoidosus.AAC.17
MLISGLKHHSQVAEENRGSRVKGDGSSKVELGELQLLLPVVDRSDPVPAIVVSFICSDGVAITCKRPVKVLVRDILVPAEAVGVGEVLVDLQGPLEEADRRLVLFLQAEAVAHDAPHLRPHAVHPLRLLRQVAELHLLLQMPIRRGEKLQPCYAVRGEALHLLEGLDRAVVLALLEVRLAQLILHPAGLQVPWRQRVQRLHRRVALIVAIVLEGLAERRQELQEVLHLQLRADARDLRRVDAVSHFCSRVKTVATELGERLHRGPLHRVHLDGHGVARLGLVGLTRGPADVPQERQPRRAPRHALPLVLPHEVAKSVHRGLGALGPQQMLFCGAQAPEAEGRLSGQIPRAQVCVGLQHGQRRGVAAGI